MKTAKEIEIDRNYEVFQVALPQILKTHYAQTALLRQQNLVGFYPDAKDAIHAGKSMFGDNMFSIQKVEPQTPIDLGWYSHV
jgi:hypothetical protein